MKNGVASSLAILDHDHRVFGQKSNKNSSRACANTNARTLAFHLMNGLYTLAYSISTSEFIRIPNVFDSMKSYPDSTVLVCYVGM